MYVPWREHARAAIALVGTPCYVLSSRAIAAALADLRAAVRCGVPQRHWLSFKTQPVKPVIEAWHRWGLDVEVASEYELVAALNTGFEPERILVNGIAKQSWLCRYQLAGLNVHLDSLGEVSALAQQAKTLGWRVGIRCQLPGECNPGSPYHPDQFGMSPREAIAASAALRNTGVPLAGVHCHINTNVRRLASFETALAHLQTVCDTLSFEPEYVDIGGGLPIPGEEPVDPASTETSPAFGLCDFGRLVTSFLRAVPTVRELWMEQGRFMTGRAGLLAVTVLDSKDRENCRYLICDGGRTNHARIAAVERHDILVEPPRDGQAQATVVCGPTCGAVDRLGMWLLPESVRVGDHILWANAGAYHIPLETRFSFGLAPVVWFDEDDIPRIARRRETTAEWWEKWT